MLKLCLGLVFDVDTENTEAKSVFYMRACMASLTSIGKEVLLETSTTRPQAIMSLFLTMLTEGVGSMQKVRQ